jgi:hypothetical protein
LNGELKAQKKVISTFPAPAFLFLLVTQHAVESLIGLMHNPAAFTSPVNEVVAWGEDTWP